MTYEFASLVASSKFKGSSYGTDNARSNSFREQSRDVGSVCQNRVEALYSQTSAGSIYNLGRRGVSL
jgi:hypothetical protein